LVGFYDPEPHVIASRATAWSTKIPAFRVYDSAKELLAQRLDGVVVEGRVFDNVQLARLALESGRPVMLEKPAGVRFAEFESLVELARRKHLHLQMIYLFRYMSAVQEMLRLCRHGDFGEVYEFRARLP